MTQQVRRIGDRRRVIPLLAAWPAALAVVVGLALLGGSGSGPGSGTTDRPEGSGAPATGSAGPHGSDPGADPTPRRAEVTAIPIAPGPMALAVGLDRVWVASAADSAVRGLDPLTGDVEIVHDGVRSGVAAPDVPPPPVAVAAGAVWAAGLPERASVVRLDPATGTVVAGVRLDDAATGILGDGRGIWVTTDAGTVERIDPATNDVTAAVASGGPVHAALGTDALWVSGGGRVLRLDPEDGRLLGEIRGGGGPVAVRDGTVWARTPGSVGSALVGIDEATGEVVERADVATSGRRDLAWSLPGIVPLDLGNRATGYAPRQQQLVELDGVTWLVRPDLGEVWRIEEG